MIHAGGVHIADSVDVPSWTHHRHTQPARVPRFEPARGGWRLMVHVRAYAASRDAIARAPGGRGRAIQPVLAHHLVLSPRRSPAAPLGSRSSARPPAGCRSARLSSGCHHRRSRRRRRGRTRLGARSQHARRACSSVSRCLWAWVPARLPGRGRPGGGPLLLVAMALFMVGRRPGGNLPTSDRTVAS